MQTKKFRNRFFFGPPQNALQGPKSVVSPGPDEPKTVLMVWQLRLAVLPDEDTTSLLANIRSFA